MPSGTAASDDRMIQAIAAPARSSPPSTVTSSRYRASASLWRITRVPAHIPRAGSRAYSTAYSRPRRAAKWSMWHTNHRRLEHLGVPTMSTAMRRQAVVLTCLTGSRKSAAARSTLSSAVKARLSVRCSRRWVCSYYRYDGHVIRPLLALRPVPWRCL